MSTDLLDALGIAVAVTAQPIDRPVWVDSHRILIVDQDATDDEVLAAAWETCKLSDDATTAGGAA